MKYLLPVNNSKISIETVEKTLQEVKPNNEIVIVHCLPDQRELHGDTFISNQEKREKLAEETIEKVQSLCERYDFANYKTEILYSTSIAEGIKTAEDRFEPDEIRMGHKNTRKDQKSITKSLLQISETPVTVVTEKMI